MITALVWYAVVTGALAAVLLLVMSVQAVLPHLPRVHLSRLAPVRSLARQRRAAEPYPTDQQPSRALESAA